MDTSRLGTTSCTQVLVVGLSSATVDMAIKTHAVGHNINIQHVDDAWTAGFVARERTPNLILLNPAVLGINKQSIIDTITASGSPAPLIVEVDNNSHNEVNPSPKGADSKEVIKQAVQQLLSA